MKVKVYVIDVPLPRWFCRLLVWSIGPFLVLGLGALAYATVVNGQPDFKDGDFLTAATLNDHLGALQSQITALTTNLATANSSISSVQAAVSDLNTTAATTKTTISALQAAVDTLNSSRVSYMLAEGSSTSSDDAYSNAVFDREVADQSSEFDGTLFTAKTAGVYQVSWSLTTSYLPWSAGDVFSGYLSKNSNGSGGSAWEGWAIEVPYAMSSYLQGTASVTIKLDAGDDLSLRFIATRKGGATTLDGSLTDNYFSVVRVQ